MVTYLYDLLCTSVSKKYQADMHLHLNEHKTKNMA